LHPLRRVAALIHDVLANIVSTYTKVAKTTAVTEQDLAFEICRPNYDRTLVDCAVNQGRSMQLLVQVHPEALTVVQLEHQDAPSLIHCG
jgi:hypothetical protein